MTLTQPAPEIARDRFGRPMVVPPGGGKPVAYTRCTTFVDAIEDKFALQQWMQRMTAIGLSQRPDLLLAVAAHKDDKTKLNKVCDDAKEAAAAHAAATTGTALHALTEQIDRGLDLGVVPIEFAPDLAAYTEATKRLTATHIEQFCVLDRYRIGGTPDRVVKYQGKRYIADIKTGSIEYGTLKIAAQLAVYARSQTYDIATGQRGMHDADLERGIVIHLPAGTGTCQLWWVDLKAGWDAVLVADRVREKRKLKFTDLTQPILTAARSIEEQIAAATSVDAVRALWTPDWGDELIDLAKARVLALQAAS